jgi:hypothetical protein
MTPSRSTPSSGSRFSLATAFTRAASSSTRLAWAITCSPASVSSTSPEPRSKIFTPSSSSSLRTEALRLGWLTNERSAARLKLRSSATATM